MPRILPAILLALVFSVFVLSQPGDAQSQESSPIDRVWSALTVADQLAQWFGDSAEIDLRPRRLNQGGLVGI